MNLTNLAAAYCLTVFTAVFIANIQETLSCKPEDLIAGAVGGGVKAATGAAAKKGTQKVVAKAIGSRVKQEITAGLKSGASTATKCDWTSWIFTTQFLMIVCVLPW